MKGKEEDRRPPPKPRKHANLWQAYLWWDELMQLRKKHSNRLSSVEAEKSKMDGWFEERNVELLTAMEEDARKELANFGSSVGPVWEWFTGIKGIGDHTAAKVIAQIDDIGKFATVSKLWRFAGYAVIDGEAEHPKAGEKRHYNSRLKSELYLIVGNFLKQQTPVYADYYYSVKADYRRKHPEKELNPDGPQKYRYTDQHIHLMTIRKVAKLLLQHLWVVWRESEGLDAGEPYIHAVKGHTHYIAPPNWPPEEEL